MISFLQFLIENRFAEVVHNNASVEQAKTLATKFRVRFAIDRSNKLHLGNAHKFTHDQLTDDPSEHTIEGSVWHDKASGKVRFQSSIVGHQSWEPIPKHPILDRMEKNGMINDNKEGINA